MAVRVERASELRDRAAVDANVEHRVDAAGRVEDARAADDEVLVSLFADEDHATSTAVSTATGPVVKQVVEDRHPDDESCAHLVDDERGVGVGDARVDLDAAVHRPRVHHLLAGPQPLRRDAPARAVLAQRRHVVRALLHPLALHAQDVDDVGVADRVDVVGDVAELRQGPAAAGRRA